MKFDGDNTYPDCKRCGSCCEINVLCMTAEDYLRIQDYVATHDLIPHDYGSKRCCFQTSEGTCMIWQARPQVCRLHHCQIPRKTILELDPSIRVDEDLWLVDLHQSFVENAQ